MHFGDVHSHDDDDDDDRAGDVGDEAISPRHGARLREHSAAGHDSTNVRENLICNVIIVVVAAAADDNVEATSAKQQAKYFVLHALARCQVSELVNFTGALHCVTPSIRHTWTCAL